MQAYKKRSRSMKRIWEEIYMFISMMSSFALFLVVTTPVINADYRAEWAVFGNDIWVLIVLVLIMLYVAIRTIVVNIINCSHNNLQTPCPSTGSDFQNQVQCVDCGKIWDEHDPEIAGHIEWMRLYDEEKTSK
jgi:hypothetical protein